MVIDVSTVIAGPGCARYLADYGAEVIKVERPGSGDSSRNMGWRDPSDGQTLWWKLVGRGKRTIVLDLKDAADLDVMLQLCDRADVLVENFRPGTLERLGLGPDVLLARNPRLVVTRVSRVRPDRAVPGQARLRHPGRGPVGLRGHQRVNPTASPCSPRSPSPTRWRRWWRPSPPWWRSTPAWARWWTST